MFANDSDGGSVSKFMAKYTQQIPKESIVEVVAAVTATAEKVQACTQQDVELKVTDVHVISRCAPNIAPVLMGCSMHGLRLFARVAVVSGL